MCWQHIHALSINIDMRRLISGRHLATVRCWQRSAKSAGLAQSRPMSSAVPTQTTSAGPAQDAPLLPGLTPAQTEKIAHTDTHLRNRHLLIEANMDDKERDTVRRKRMIYRSKQRGWLEADLLMGSWAVRNVPTLTAEELDQYELLLKEETIDIYNYLSGKDKLPDHLKDLSVMKKMQGYALTQNMSGPEAYENVKKETNLT